jgi:hypothetical protein
VCVGVESEQGSIVKIEDRAIVAADFQDPFLQLSVDVSISSKRTKDKH